MEEKFDDDYVTFIFIIALYLFSIKGLSSKLFSNKILEYVGTLSQYLVFI